MKRLLVVAFAAALAVALSSGRTGAQVAPADQAADTDELTILSLNLAMRGDVDRIAAEMLAINADTADVMLLQEVAGDTEDTKVAVELGDRFGLHAVRSDTAGGNGDVGLAVLSRYPATDVRLLALKRFSLTFRSRDRFALAATLATPSGPLRIYNVHLDTRINTGDRLDQVSPVTEDLARFPERAVVAGDFNTNGNLWLFHTIPLPFLGRQGAGLEQFMARHGLQSVFDGGPTHDALRMRLDWVFLKGLEATTRSIHPMAVSDHHALVVSVAAR